MNLFKYAVLAVFLSPVTTCLNAQKTVTLKVQNSLEMTEDLDEVWTAISNLGNLNKLVPELISATASVGNGKGSLVTLTLKANGAIVVEKITKLDNKKRSISYEMLETPMPISKYKATIHLVPKDAGNYTIHFKATLKTEERNKEKMRTTIENFQRTLLTNIKNGYYEK